MCNIKFGKRTDIGKQWDIRTGKEVNYDGIYTRTQNGDYVAVYDSRGQYLGVKHLNGSIYKGWFWPVNDGKVETV